MKRRPLHLVLLALFAASCSRVGPGTVPIDRFAYGAAIADSWKEQTLLNIVKLRYLDVPVFLDVQSIVAGYSMQTGVTVNGTLSSQKAVQGDFAAAGVQGIYTDRPTITYVPMTGERFLRGLITPIDPKNIFFMLQTGYPADFILALTVESINGVRNRSSSGGWVREADPEFVRALELLRDVQKAGAFGMRVEEAKDKGSVGVVYFRAGDVSPEIAAKVAEIHRLLKLPDSEQRFVLKYSPVRGEDNELSVASRSMLQIMQAFASFIDVPEEHLRAQSATRAFEGRDRADRSAAIEIRSGTAKPANAFAAVHYRDHWYWIDDGDWRTKRALGAVMLFFTLTDTGTPDRLPLITIPAQ